MATKTISGIKTKSPLRGRLEKIKTAGLEFSELGIVTGANSTNAVMQSDAIMTSLNITVSDSHEGADFSLVNDPNKKEEIGDTEPTNEQILLLEPSPIDATDKFRPSDAAAGLVDIGGELQPLKRSTFYEQDDEPSMNYQESQKAKRTNLEGQMKIAMGKFLATPTAKVKNSDGTNLPSASEKYRGKARRKR